MSVKMHMPFAHSMHCMRCLRGSMKIHVSGFKINADGCFGSVEHRLIHVLTTVVLLVLA